MRHKYSLLICSVVLFILALPVVAYVIFAQGMVNTNSAKSVHEQWTRQYVAIVKQANFDIENVVIYYKQGRICFDFVTKSNLSTDNFKNIVNITKAFIQSQVALPPLMSSGYSDQTSIRLLFLVNKDSYVFESPYWVPTENTKDNSNMAIHNNYKIWYFMINDILKDTLVL